MDTPSTQKPHRPNAKLTEAQVRAIRQAHASGTSAYRLAKEYGVTRPAVRLIILRRTWPDVA